MHLRTSVFCFHRNNNRAEFYKIQKYFFKKYTNFFIFLDKITEFFCEVKIMENIVEKLQREEIIIANLKKRTLAFVIDDLIITILFFMIYYDSFISVNDDFVALQGKITSFVWQLLALRVIYQTFFVWKYGATIGKIILKIRCLDENMLDIPSFSKAFLRACVRILSESCFYLGFAWAFGNKARQTWHDKIARTIVCEIK